MDMAIGHESFHPGHDYSVNKRETLLLTKMDPKLHETHINMKLQ